MMAVVASYAKLLDSSSLTGPQYYILRALAYGDMQTCSQFAKTLNVTLSAVTNLSNKLVRSGCVERVPSETDRRQVYLRITEKGRQVERDLLERYKQLTEGLWHDFSDEELDALIPAYEKIIDRLERRIAAVEPDANGHV